MNTKVIDIISELGDNINMIITEALNQQITVTINSIESVHRFKERLDSIARFIETLGIDFNEGTNPYVVQYLFYLYGYIEVTYKYREGSYSYKVMNSIKDAIAEALTDIYNI